MSLPEETIIAMLKQGYTHKYIADTVNVPISKVNNTVQKYWGELPHENVRRKSKQIYTIYDDTELVFIGDKHECAEFLNITSNAFIRRKLNKQFKGITITLASDEVDTF